MYEIPRVEASCSHAGAFVCPLFICIQQRQPSCGARCDEVDDALVARAAKMEGEVALLLAVVAVDEDVELVEEGIHGGVLLCTQFLQCVACVAPDIETAFVRCACKRKQCRWLQKGLTAAEGEPCEKRIGVEVLEHCTDGGDPSAVRRLRIRIMTAGTAARAALGKDGQAYPLAVDDGVACNPCDTDLSGVRA